MLTIIFLINSIILLSIARKSLKFDGAIKFIVFGQLFYMFLGLIIRPVILYITQPIPEYGDAFSDYRLIVNGSYNQALSKISLYILFGISIYGVSLVYLEKITRKKSKHMMSQNYELNTLPILLVLILAFVANTIEYGSIFDSRFITWISATALPCSGIAMQAIMKNFSSARIRTLLFCTIGVYAFAISVLMKSKSPVFFFLFMFFLLYFENLTKQKRKYVSIKSTFTGISFLVFSYCLFILIQGIKDGQNLTSLNERIGHKYFGSFNSLYTILKRFDLFRSVSDVWHVGQGAWFSVTEYLQIMVKALEWNFGTFAPNFGAQWSINVLHQSPDTTFAPVVSLAQSPIAEGWLLAGIPGVFFNTVIFVLISVSIGSMIYSNLFLRVIALYVVSSNSLFEAGLIANLESISTGVRTSILTWLILKLLSGLQINYKRAYP